MRPKGHKGQAAILMAVVIALLFALFTLMFEVGRLLIAREVIISATRRAGEAGLSYIVDYARNRADFNEKILAARRNTQVWQPFYEEKTGVPKFIRAQIFRYLIENLKEGQIFIPQAQIDQVGMSGIVFPYKEPNWPTSTIGATVKVTVAVPLMLLGQFGSIPITIETISITSIEEVLGISTTQGAVIGAGGTSSEFTGVSRPIPGSTVGWVEPFLHFNESHQKLINQFWGCPKSPVSAYSYALGRHAGMDFGVPEDSQLFAVASGTVTSTGVYPNQVKPASGNFAVILQTEGGVRVTYMHMAEIVVKQGEQVIAGQLLGTSDGDPAKHPPGFAGFSTGAHLHFQAAQGGPEGRINFDFPFDIDPAPLLGITENGARPPPGPKEPCAYGAPPP